MPTRSNATVTPALPALPQSNGKRDLESFDANHDGKIDEEEQVALGRHMASRESKMSVLKTSLIIMSIAFVAHVRDLSVIYILDFSSLVSLFSCCSEFVPVK